MSQLKLGSRPLRRLFDFFKPKPNEVPCMGLALGREAVWAVSARESGGGRVVEWCERIPLMENFFTGEPSAEGTAALKSVLAVVEKKTGGNFTHLQVALPDPLVRFEVFELDKIPAAGSARDEFLAWRFNQDREADAPSLSFTSQVLGEEEGKKLLLAQAVESRWLEALKTPFQSSGLIPSIVDMGLGYRFNFFHDFFLGGGEAGALLTFEPEFWSLALWDKKNRPCFARSKWYGKDGFDPKGRALEEVVLEIERSIRSFVYSGKNRSVENLFVLAPESWGKPLLKAMNQKTKGKCVNLSFGEMKSGTPGIPFLEMAPSSVAAAVAR